MTRALEAQLRAVLAARYHHLHPFNLRLHAGECSRAEVQRWVRNRFYYQTRIPIKDGLILTKAEDRAFRRDWIRRIQDHDGADENSGGLELWLQLAEAAGLVREEVASLRVVLPGVRRACDAYVEFVQSHSLLESVAASLTELAAGPFLAARAEAFRKHYGWIAERGLAYFLARTSQAPRDAEEGLAFVLAHAGTDERAEACVRALTRKCEILGALLDGVVWGGRRPALARGAKLRAHATLGDLLLSPERAVKLGGSGREILACCDGTRSVEEVALAQRRAHPDAPDELEREVFAFIEKMERERVLVLNS